MATNTRMTTEDIRQELTEWASHESCESKERVFLRARAELLHLSTRALPKVKALEWVKLRELCHVSSPCDNLEYRVLEQGLDFFVTINGERFGSSNSVGLAKQMAQGHFECLILDQIEV